MINRFIKLREQKLREKQEQQEKLLQLRNGQVSLSPDEEEEPPERIMGLDLSRWEDRSYEERERSLHVISSFEGAHKEEGVRKDDALHTRSMESSSKVPSEAPASVATATVVVRERNRTVDELSQKATRAKRESRRMRELEQAKFSLELLKVRANSSGALSPSEERRWSVELVPPATPPLRSPQGTPDSQSSKGSFELISMDEEPPKATEEVTDSEDLCSPPPALEPGMKVLSISPNTDDLHRTEDSDASTHPGHQGQPKMELAPSSPAHPPKIENYLPTFYVPASEGGSVVSRSLAEEAQQQTEAAVSTSTTPATTITKPLKVRHESVRRPVVVVISMQKEIPLSEELSNMIWPPVELRDSAAQTGELTPSPQQQDPVPAPPVPVPTSVPQADQAVIEKLVRLNEEKEERQRNQQQQNEREMMEQIRQQKEELERQRLVFAQNERDRFEKHRVEALHRIQQSRQGGIGGAQAAVGAATSSKPLRPSSLLIDRAAASLAPHTRTQSESSDPLPHSPLRGDIKGSAPHPRLAPPPSSAPRERMKGSRPAAEGWAPKLTLESRDGGGARARAPSKKTHTNQGATVSMSDKPGNIFFSPKDKVTFAK